MAKALKGIKTRCDGEMTESAYLAFIRSTLRSKSLRWPPRSTALNNARRAYVGPNKLQKWEYKCAMCLSWFKAKEVCVDHFPVAAGSIRSVEDIGEFCQNLFCDSSNLRVLCNPCHAIHTLVESSGMTYEEAKVAKEVTLILKDKKKALDMLAKAGYTGVAVSNEDKRKALLTTILKEK